jgi:rubredoxin
MTDKIHICAACAFEYETSDGNAPDFHSLPDDWQCPECGIAKFMFHHYDCQDLIADFTGGVVPPPTHPFSPLRLDKLV